LDGNSQAFAARIPDCRDASAYWILAPRLSAAIPSDVIDGTPLRYRLDPDGGYALYSIG
jgi:hypothetical protein